MPKKIVETKRFLWKNNLQRHKRRVLSNPLNKGRLIKFIAEKPSRTECKVFYTDGDADLDLTKIGVKKLLTIFYCCSIPHRSLTAFIFALTNPTKFILLIEKPNSEINFVNNYYLHIHLPAATQLRSFIILYMQQH